MNKFLCWTSLSVAVALVAVATLSAAEEGKSKKGVEVGQKAPTFENLKGVDGKTYSSSDYEDAKATVVVFTCNGCPVARAYEERLNQIAKDYKNKGVEVVAINVNSGAGDELPKMKERAEEQDLVYAYVRDPSQKIGKQYGATVTPHVYILDKDQKVAYIGAIDDNMEVEKAEKKYVRDALDALLAGDKPEQTKTKPVGCGIRYSS